MRFVSIRRACFYLLSVLLFFAFSSFPVWANDKTKADEILRLRAMKST